MKPVYANVAEKKSPCLILPFRPTVTVFLRSAGNPIHVETALPDTPEMFCYVADLVKSCCDSYVIGLTSAMRRYSSGMGSKEHDAQILELVRQTNAQVLTILNERMKEK